MKRISQCTNGLFGGWTCITGVCKIVISQINVSDSCISLNYLAQLRPFAFFHPGLFRLHNPPEFWLWLFDLILSGARSVATRLPLSLLWLSTSQLNGSLACSASKCIAVVIWWLILHLQLGMCQNSCVLNRILRLTYTLLIGLGTLQMWSAKLVEIWKIYVMIFTEWV